MEALAMAGADCQEWGLSIEEWELQESVVPPHLLADDSDEEEDQDLDDDDSVCIGLATKRDVTCDIRASVGKWIKQSISNIVIHLKLLKFLTLILENFLFSHVIEFLL
ncbi:hypothetical protein EUTSA_v10000443mg [Eutrema salsugineum]|uniref:Uncharacterized protein n=1 Tax=Eutrema salsugineum TaxID=72664 RepID=V4LUH8_EUTSA|nr:uncharacterized protein LOC18021750 [Eutrema salsugineum]ESQ46142.1 hypothetical protein EUTSA_v10000443mg [Eutrema salsugineum]